MNRFRASSSPDLCPPTMTDDLYDDSALEGVAANVKLLLKLIQDHKDACRRHTNDGRRMLRVAGMMTILDNVRNRIQQCQSFGNKTLEGELRRCSTDVRPHEPPNDENERLRKQLSASLAARKSLEIMCSSLGKEKEIMAGELARKVHELDEMEELLKDFRAQNETLLEKVKECAAEHKDRGITGGETLQGNAALQERNKALSEQLLRSLDGYRSMKRKLREALEENAVIRATMEEMGIKVGDSLEQIRGFKQKIANRSEQEGDLEEEISQLEHMFESFETMVSKHVRAK